MKQKIKHFVGFYLAFLIFAVACDDNCGPFDDKFTVTGIDWEIPVRSNESINFEQFYISIRPEAAYFNSSRTTSSLDLISKSYACSPVPPDTDDLLLNLEITANRDFNTAFPQGQNLVDLFDVNVSYYRSGIDDQLSLAEFISINRRFPDVMTLKLKQAPDAGEPFVFTFKFTLDGTDLDYYEFNTSTFSLTL